MIRVTTEDLETGDTESVEIEDDWVLTVAGSHYLHHVAKHGNGTVVLTIKRGENG